jgi:FkbM family methyltransferase
LSAVRRAAPSRLPKAKGIDKLLRVKLLRLIPPGTRGKHRFARFLLKRQLSSAPFLLREVSGFSFRVPSLQDPIGFSLLVDGVYEPLLLKFLLDHLAEGSVFLDIGSNVGVFTLPAAKKVGLSGRVVSLEASPAVFPFLEENVAKSGFQNIFLKQRAVYDRDLERLDFYEAPPDRAGMGSIARQFNASPVAVRASTLDGILAEAGLEVAEVMKVDVEGCESKVFSGAAGLLSAKTAPLIAFEFCDWAESRIPGQRAGQSQKILLDYGYRLWRLKDFLRGARPLGRILERGFETLVAAKKR